MFPVPFSSLGQVSGQQAKEEVAQLVRGLGAVLEEKRATLLQAIDECQQERLARLGAQLQEHRSLLDGSGLVGYAQEVLKETDQPCFVQAAKQLHHRYPLGTILGSPSSEKGRAENKVVVWREWERRKKEGLLQMGEACL